MPNQVIICAQKLPDLYRPINSYEGMIPHSGSHSNGDVCAFTRLITLTKTLTPVNEFGVRGSSDISETVMKLAPYFGGHM